MEQTTQTRSWSGSFTLTSHPNLHGGYQNVFVTTANTDMSAHTELWPPHLNVYTPRRPVSRAEIANWVRRHSPPVCVFMANKHPDPAVNSQNQACFSSFVHYLLGNNFVAYAPWASPERLPGAGIVLYPSDSTGDSLLLGAIFTSTPFPDFLPPVHSSGPGAGHAQSAYAPTTSSAGYYGV
ncbi:unnamed protein product [Peniophora sp. CBMAI 1063]|nr:unnamed protein product [Peniophora sp. CBMAI 1063]